MAIAISLGQFLDAHHVPYDVLLQERTMTARSTARVCEIEAGRLAKAVLMRCDNQVTPDDLISALETRRLATAAAAAVKDGYSA